MFLKRSGQTKVKCTLCGVVLTYIGGSTSPMNNHLKALYPTTLSTNSSDRSKLSDYFKPNATDNSKEKISELVANWIASDMLLVSIVDSPNFSFNQLLRTK